MPEPVRVLVTGMSGAGKTTVLDALASRGCAVLDVDDDLAVEVATDDGGVEQMWRIDDVREVLDRHVDGVLVVAGCARNQGELRDRFDRTILLSAPIEVMLARIDAREKGFGRDPDERSRVLADLAAVEPLLRAACDVEIRTDRPLADVAADVEAAITRS